VVREYEVGRRVTTAPSLVPKAGGRGGAPAIARALALEAKEEERAAHGHAWPASEPH
jgi:hypothetical protein